MIYLATLTCIVTVDLLTGVLLGVGLAMLKLVYTVSHLSIKFEDNAEENRAVMHLHGAATFVSLPKLAAALDRVPATRHLQVFLDHLDYVDHACLRLLMDWERQHQATGGRLLIDWNELRPRFQRQSLSANGDELARASAPEVTTVRREAQLEPVHE